jgi:hypothetical protein
MSASQIESAMFEKVLNLTNVGFTVNETDVTSEQVAASDGALPAFQAIAEAIYRGINKDPQNGSEMSLGYIFKESPEALMGVECLGVESLEPISHRSLYLLDALTQFLNQFMPSPMEEGRKIFRLEDLESFSAPYIEMAIGQKPTKVHL